VKDPFALGSAGDLVHLRWTDIEDPRIVYRGPIFDVCTIKRISSDGRIGDFVKVLSPEWVTAIPWYRNEEGRAMFVMEQQFRHGSSTVTREFPSGLVEKGEDPKDAVLRELLEETGNRAKKVTLLGNVNPNSAFMSNRTSFFLIEGLDMVAGQHLDMNEQLDVLSLPVTEVIGQMGSGMYDNGIMMIALGFFMKEASKHPQLLQ